MSNTTKTADLRKRQDKLDAHDVFGTATKDEYEQLADDAIDYAERLEAENKRLQERDGNASIELTYNDGINPFERIELQSVDFSVADNWYVVELPDMFTITKRGATNDTP